MAIQVLLLIWAGLNYLGQGHILALGAQAQSRGCAWRMAATGCTEVPAGCEAQSAEGQAPEEAKRLEEEGESSAGDGSLSDVVKNSVLGQVRDLFVSRAEASAGAELEQPKFLGGGKKSVGGHYSVVCNTIPESLGEMVERVSKDLKEELF